MVEHFSETDQGYNSFCGLLKVEYPSVDVDEIPYFDMTSDNYNEDSKKFVAYLQNMEMPAHFAEDEDVYKEDYIIVKLGKELTDGDWVPRFDKFETMLRPTNIRCKRMHISSDDEYVWYRILKVGSEL